MPAPRPRSRTRPPALGRRLRAAAALGALAALPLGSARAQAPLAPGGWQLFTYLLGAGNPVEGDGFTLTVAGRTRLRVVETGFTGDRFDLFANGVRLFTTGAVSSPGAFTPYLDVADGDAAWGSAAPEDLSRGEAFLDAGSYRITLGVAAAGSGFDDGGGFVRADAAPLSPPDPSVVPEPGTVALAGAGLVALAALRRRRRPAA